ncbi:kelch domain-containing protein [Podospora didyma]|uniref:Kelch domain-containing protein n=1 Tax=Podospora didyma TaxID=330526 RepID=A0AAE0KJT1_9PEZI|nr:kelch domain-containing protein [Podospora didyma]
MAANSSFLAQPLRLILLSFVLAACAGNAHLGLDTRQSAWKTLAPVPAGAIHEHSTVALSTTQLAIIGGVLQTGGVIDSVYIYDIPKDSWQKVASLPVTINHANAAAVDGKIYVLGGMTGASWAGTPKCWAYDPPSNKWTSIASMTTSEARGSAVAGVYNRTIWLASGKTGSGGESVATVSAYDVITGQWLTSIPEKAKRIPGGRDHGGGGVIGTKFYQIAGSLGPISNRTDTVFVLDLEDLAKGWITAKGRMPTPRRGFATAVVGKKFYTFGGEGNPSPESKGVFKEVEVYDTETDTWASLAPMNIPRHGSSAAAVGGRIYIPGGGTASGTPATAAFDVFTP